MAGDWIKVQGNIVNAPEVLKVSRLLKVKPAEAMGLIIQFWIWADQTTIDGYIAHVTPDMLDDDVMHRPGFAAAMIDAKWLEFDDGGLIVPSFEKHNGESAKKRATARDRMKKHRKKE